MVMSAIIILAGSPLRRQITSWKCWIDVWALTIPFAKLLTCSLDAASFIYPAAKCKQKKQPRGAACWLVGNNGLGTEGTGAAADGWMTETHLIGGINILLDMEKMCITSCVSITQLRKI